MSVPLDDEDARVLQEVRSVFTRLDPVPEGLTAGIKYAMTVRLLEAEVAELTTVPELTSRAEAGELTTTMSFTGSRLSLMVTVGEDGELLRLDCWVTLGGALVELCNDQGEQGQVADEFGRLVFTGVRPGSVHFIVWPDATRQGRPVITPAVGL